MSFEEAQREHDRREPEEPAKITLTQEQRDALRVVVALLEEHDCHHIAISLASSFRAGGRPIDRGRRTDVSARVNGGSGESSDADFIDAIAIAIGEAKREAES